MTVPLDSFDAMAAGTENFTYNVASQTSTAGYVYDVSGRMTAAPGQTFAWDGASRLTKIGNVDLTYNGMGDLITRNDGTNSTRYFYNHAVGLHPIMGEKNESGSPLARYYVWTPGGQLLYMIDAANGNKVYCYHFDRIGSTLALTDSTGAITDKYAYDPYGRILQKTGTNSQPFTFAGQWGMRQENTTLYHARARYYDATTGRFLSKEPLWPQITDPRLLNPYQYARNNPVMLVDPTGNEPVSPLPITPVYVEGGLAPDPWTTWIFHGIEVTLTKKSYTPTDKGRRFGVMGDESKVIGERNRNIEIGIKRKTVKKFAKPLFVNVQDEGDKIVVLIIDRSGTIPMVVDMFEIGKDELEAGKPKADKGVGSGVTRIEGENIVESAFRDKVADAVKIAVDSR
jgi:RHS repeat-associated protein